MSVRYPEIFRHFRPTIAENFFKIIQHPVGHFSQMCNDPLLRRVTNIVSSVFSYHHFTKSSKHWTRSRGDGISLRVSKSDRHTNARLRKILAFECKTVQNYLLFAGDFDCAMKIAFGKLLLFFQQ